MADNKYPRVLVISHNPFSKSQNNGKTLSAFFEGWPKSKIAQIFLTPSVVNDSICGNFFRITDLDVLKHIFFRNKKIGQKITTNLSDNKEEKHRIWQKKIHNVFKKMPLASYARNWCWEIARPWKNNNLTNWVEDFGPQVIFFQSSSSYAVFDMVLYLVQKYNIPLFMEITDDYLSSKFSLNPLFWSYHYKIVRRYKLAIEQSKTIFVIGDQMREEYSKKFSGNFKIASNSMDAINKKIIPYSKIHNDVLILTYAGNLGLNRWKVLRKIGLAIRKINAEGNIKAQLDVYSIDKPNKKILSALTIQGAMAYRGALTQEELLAVRNQSDILVHVESFDKKNMHVTRLSISTKIPECLLSQRCVLAIGPNNVASIRHLQDNNISFVVPSLNRRLIIEKIKLLLSDRSLREYYIKRGYEYAKDNYSFANNKKLVQNEIIQTGF